MAYHLISNVLTRPQQFLGLTLDTSQPFGYEICLAVTSLRGGVDLMGYLDEQILRGVVVSPRTNVFFLKLNFI